MKRLLRYLGLLLLSGSFLLAPAYAHAETSALETAEQVVVIERADTVEVIFGFSTGAAPTTTLVVPVPGRPAASVVGDGAPLFAYLAEVTRPAIRVEPRYIIGIPPFVDPAPTALPVPNAPPLPRADIRAYTADDPRTLVDWLAVHELVLGAGDQTTLTAHLDAGGTVLIVTFAEALNADALPALQLSYSGAAPQINPASAPFDLFVLAAGRRAAASLETLYAGPASELEPAPPVDLLPLFAADMYVTHLRSSEPYTAAITLQAAPTDEPLRRTSVVQEDIYLFERSSTLIGLGLIACLSMLALVGAVAMRRRLDAISPDS